MQQVYQDLENQPSLKELVKETIVVFSHYRSENFYYNVQSKGWNERTPFGDRYQFPVPIDDIGNATMLAEDKAMLYMRWIRKAIDNHTLIKL